MRIRVKAHRHSSENRNPDVFRPETRIKSLMTGRFIFQLIGSYTVKDDKIQKEMIDFLMEKIGGGFSDKVLEYGNEPVNYGAMEKPDGYGKITGPCGDTVEIFLRIRNDKIADISYTTDGCMTSHAAVSAATVMAKGKPVRECIKINQSAILEHLGGMPEDSEHCALLAAKTFHKALRHYAVGKKNR